MEEISCVELVGLWGVKDYWNDVNVSLGRETYLLFLIPNKWMRTTEKNKLDANTFRNFVISNGVEWNFSQSHKSCFLRVKQEHS